MFLWLAGLFAAFVLSACAQEKGAAPVTSKTVADFFPVKIAGKTLRMQVAVNPPEMQRGLMGRKDLGPDDAMIFVYAKPQQLSFWMRNTPTPLDIGFFNASGILEEVYPLYPFNENAVPSRSSRLQLAVETNQNWYRENGIKPGAQIDLKALSAALRARGFDPRRFGF